MSRRRLAGGLAALAVVLTGCAAPGGGAGAHNDVGKCASVIALARSAVPGGEAPVIIRPVTREDVSALSREAGIPAPKPAPHPKPAGPPPSPPPTDAAGEPIPKTCLVVIPGRFSATSVPGAVPTGRDGDHVLVIARTRPAGIDRLLLTTGIPADATPRPWWQFWST